MLQQNTSHQPTGSLSQDRYSLMQPNLETCPGLLVVFSTPENPEGNKLHLKRQGALALPDKGDSFKACLLNKIQQITFFFLQV